MFVVILANAGSWASLFVFYALALTAVSEDMVTYVFQIMSQLLELSPAGGVSSAYETIYPPLLEPVLWERTGNIPGLVRLLQAYIHKCPQLVVSNNLERVLLQYQKLLGSRSNDHYGVALAQAVVQYVPAYVTCLFAGCFLCYALFSRFCLLSVR